MNIDKHCIQFISGVVVDSCVVFSFRTLAVLFLETRIGWSFRKTAKMNKKDKISLLPSCKKFENSVLRVFAGFSKRKMTSSKFKVQTSKNKTVGWGLRVGKIVDAKNRLIIHLVVRLCYLLKLDISCIETECHEQRLSLQHYSGSIRLSFFYTFGVEVSLACQKFIHVWKMFLKFW